MNFEIFHGWLRGTATLNELEASSAGVEGWEAFEAEPSAVEKWLCGLSVDVEVTEPPEASEAELVAAAAKGAPEVRSDQDTATASCAAAPASAMDELGVADLCSRAPRLRGDELEEQELLAALLLSARLAGPPPVDVPLPAADGVTDDAPTLTVMEAAVEATEPPVPPAPAAGAWWWPAALKATVVTGDAPAAVVAATTSAEHERGEGGQSDAVSCASSAELVGASDATDEWERLSLLSGASGGASGGGASSDLASVGGCSSCDEGGPDATLSDADAVDALELLSAI